MASEKTKTKKSVKTPRAPSVKGAARTTDKVGDVLVNQAGVKYTITGEKYVPLKGYDDGVTKTRKLTVKADGVGSFDIGEHEFKYYRDRGILKRMPKTSKANTKKR